jgi:hypothetical protein
MYLGNLMSWCILWLFFHHRYGFKGIFLAIFIFAIQVVPCKLIVSKLAILAVAQEDYILTGHTVEFDVNSFSVIFFGVENNGLNSNGKIQVNDLEGSVEDVSG